MTRRRDMTQGSITKQLVIFALPLLASSLIQQLYNTVDLAFVGQFLNKEASAAVGSSGLLVTCLVGFFTGMGIGASVAAARFFGARDWGGLKLTVHTAMAISLIGGVVFSVVGFLLTPMFLRWLNTPEVVMEDAIGYCQIYFLGLIPLVTYNIGAGILRALGDSRSPMIYQLYGGLFNVVGNVLVLMVLGGGINGVAAITVIAQAIAAVLTVRDLCRLDEGYRLRLKHIGFDWTLTKMILVVGIPAGIQAMAITFSNLFIQYHINSLDVVSIAAFYSYFKVELFIYLPIISIGQAVTSFTAQNIGAQAFDRVSKGTRRALLLGVGMTVVLSALILACAWPMFRIFTSDLAVIDRGITLAFITFPFYFFYVFMEVLGSVIRGAGKAIPPMVIVLANMCGIRLIILAVFMALWDSAEVIALTFPITWFLTSLCMAAYYKFGNWLPAVRYTVHPTS